MEKKPCQQSGFYDNSATYQILPLQADKHSRFTCTTYMALQKLLKIATDLGPDLLFEEQPFTKIVVGAGHWTSIHTMEVNLNDQPSNWSTYGRFQ